eukprot:g15327.t1
MLALLWTARHISFTLRPFTVLNEHYVSNSFEVYLLEVYVCTIDLKRFTTDSSVQINIGQCRKTLCIYIEGRRTPNK